MKELILADFLRKGIGEKSQASVRIISPKVILFEMSLFVRDNNTHGIRVIFKIRGISVSTTI